MMLTHLDDQIATPNHISTQNGVSRGVGSIDDKGGELRLGYGFPLYNQSFRIIQSENFRSFPAFFSRIYNLKHVKIF